MIEFPFSFFGFLARIRSLWNNRNLYYISIMMLILQFMKKTIIVVCFCLLFTVSILKSSEKEGVNIVY